MRFFHFGILIFSLVTALSLHVAYAEGLSIERALQEGQEHSPKIQRLKAVVEESHARHLASFQGFLPSLSLTGSYLFDKQYQYVDMNIGNTPSTVPQIIPTTDWTLNLSIPLFDGLANYHRYQNTKLSSSAAELEYEWAKLQLEQEIRLRFYQALTASKILMVSEQNVNTLREHLKQTQDLKRSGVVTNYDVLRVEVQLNEAQSEVLKSEDDLAMANRKLFQTMGSDEEPSPLIGELWLPDANNIPEDNTLFHPNERKDLMASNQREAASQENAIAANRFWVPKISFGGQWKSYNNRTNSFSDQSNFRWAYSLGVFLTWNLFDGLASESRSQEALAQEVQMQKTTRINHLQAKYDFNFWRRRFLYSSNLYHAKLNDQKKAEESVRLAKDSYRAGAHTSSEVLDAELELFRARAGVVNSQMNSIEAFLNLELAVGHKLQKDDKHESK